MKHFFRIFVLGVLLMAWNTTMAQVQNEATPGYDFSSPDSTVVDSAVAEDPQAEKPVDPLMKPYERIVLYIDSSTNLITYLGVVEQEESGSDSLYLRAKKWALTTYGKDAKIELDKRNQKLTYLASIPAYVYTSKYAKRNIGTFEFRFTILIKEGRYKYQISNLVHESYKPAQGKSTRNYFEYYYSSTTRVRDYDAILVNANKDILKMIDSFKMAMREPPLIDEDDW